MDDSSGAPAAWTLRHNVAQLVAGRLAGNVDVTRPDQGFRCTALDHDSAPCSLFCTSRADVTASIDFTNPEHSLKSWPLAIADAYVRGNDLVTSYRPCDEWPYAPQLYWQAGALDLVEGTLASLSQLVSVQTHLLNTHPKIQVASQVLSSEAFFITVREDGAANIDPVKQKASIMPSGTTCCVLWRLPAAAETYVEVVSGNDVQAIEIAANPQSGWSVRWHLFAEFLEKGVIRRARVHGTLLPRANDTEIALECCRAAEQCPLPLTT
jgi:hypothetical protein